MAALLALIFFVLPIAEIAALMAVGDVIGFWPTIIALIAISVAGAVLAKRQGVEVWRRFRSTISRGQIPSAEILDGMLILLGGALLLTPGFITDVLGLILLVPVSRTVVKRLAVRASGWWIGKRFGLTRMGRRDRQVVVTSTRKWPGASKRRAHANGSSSAAVQTPPEVKTDLSAPVASSRVADGTTPHEIREEEDAPAKVSVSEADPAPRTLPKNQSE
jgi:UPF0716 protein FxsA